jgi:hypothetical protein
MKTLLRSKAALLIIVAGLAFACKKNETAPADNYNETDTTQTTVDSVETTIDSTTTNSGTDMGASGSGTTGASGATGSGAAGTTQSGTSGSTADTTTTAPRR